MNMNEPLAIKLRPKNIDQIVGQKHLVGDNKIIRNMVNNKKIFSHPAVVVTNVISLGYIIYFCTI